MDKQTRGWWLNEGKLRERAAIVRLLKRLETVEQQPRYRGLLHQVADMVKGR